MNICNLLYCTVKRINQLLCTVHVYIRVMYLVLYEPVLIEPNIAESLHLL